MRGIAKRFGETVALASVDFTAARGEIPTIRIGRLLRVPVRAMEALLDRAGRHEKPEGA